MSAQSQNVNAELLEVCKALLPYAESSRVPGPAMSDPWKPPEDVIRRARDVIARATAVGRMCDGCGEKQPYDPILWLVQNGDGCLWYFCPTCKRKRESCDVEERRQHASRID